VKWLLDGYFCGVFGTNGQQKSLFENSIAKKSEAEGIIVFHRNESGKRYSFLDDSLFPDKIQGCARIASLSDYAYYVFPSNLRLSAPDGELAVLLDSLAIPGAIEVIDSDVDEKIMRSNFKGLRLESYVVDRRGGQSSIIDLKDVMVSQTFPRSGTLVYIDRAFNVKGVGVVVLGFVLSGKIDLHDRLRLIPTSSSARYAEVKGIQVSDEDQESCGRGIRVGLSLKGVEVKDLSKTVWLDDSSFPLSDKISFQFGKSPYYRQDVLDRDLHFQLPGEMLPGKISKGQGEGILSTALSSEVPLWSGMRVCVIDLNAKNLRVCGGGSVTV
jgi:selenocysteine-specific translation elongation factor